MNRFVAAATGVPEAKTANGAETFATSTNPVVDLFFIVGSLSKGNSNAVNVSALWDAAFRADPERATRLMLWARDIRGGQGRRQVFRDWLQFIETAQPELCAAVIPFVPTYGRWDDLLVFRTAAMKERAYTLIGEALRAGHGLAAKWMPRTGRTAVEIARHMGLAKPHMPDATFLRRFRRDVARMSKTVEQTMSSREFSEINYDHVPGVAMIRYRKAFGRHDFLRFNEWIQSLVKQPAKKMNVDTLYPFNIIQQLGAGSGSYRNTSYGNQVAGDTLLEEQWKRLPNYVGNANILPIVDVSGSMTSPVQGSVRALDVSISLGLYLAEKNEGAFKNLIVNFSDKSELVQVDRTKSLRQRANEVAGMNWGGSTNLQAAFENILAIATKGRVPQEEMPTHLLVISDMEFNSTRGGSNLEAARVLFERAGYRLPKVVFWNVNGREKNVPARAFEQDVAMVSAFSPAIMTAILGVKEFNPMEVVENAIMKDRYNIWDIDPSNVPQA